MATQKAPVRGRKPHVRETGTDIATRTHDISRGIRTPAASPQTPPRRVSATRASDYLTLRQVELLRSAAAFAWASGMPLTRHVTVHLGKAGIDDADAGPLISALLKQAGDWIRYHGGTFAAAWAREYATGQERGSHVHIAMHVPDCLAVGMWRAIRRWRRRSGMTAPPGARIQRTRVIGRILGSNRVAPEFYAANLDAVMSYLAKGGEPIPAVEALVSRPLKYGGRVIGKRCGTTRNIGAAAQRNFGGTLLM